MSATCSAYFNAFILVVQKTTKRRVSELLALWRQKSIPVGTPFQHRRRQFQRKAED